jgi:hypothetical protein
MVAKVKISRGGLVIAFFVGMTAAKKESFALCTFSPSSAELNLLLGAHCVRLRHFRSLLFHSLPSLPLYLGYVYTLTVRLQTTPCSSS